MKKNPPIINEYTHGKPLPYRTNPFKKDVFYGDDGQYAHPGQVTRIPGDAFGTHITMKGINQPLYARDNQGNEQMMQPGEDYQFPGQYVTEYPMAAYGGDPSLPAVGGWLDDEEFKRGGMVNPLMKSRSKRSGTSKNIQSSINKIFLRNHEIFGPGGKNIYNPKSKYQDGASVLPKLKHQQDLADASQVAADFKGSNRISTTAVNKFIPKLTEEDLALAQERADFSKLPKSQQDAVNKQNQLMYSTRPEAQLVQGKKLNKEEQEYSDKVGRRIKHPFSDVGIAAGNIASYLSRFEGMSPEEIAATTNNPYGALQLSSDIATEALANELIGAGTSKGFSLLKKGVAKPLSKIKAPGKTIVPVEKKIAAPTVNPFPDVVPEVERSFKQPIKVAKTKEEALQNILSVDDWHNFENKYQGKDIAKSGHFNKGVFELEGHPDYLAKIEAPHGIGAEAQTIGSNYPDLDMVNLHKDITSPNIGRIVKQIPHPKDPSKRILIMNKVEGKALKDLSVPQLKRIPKEAFVKLDAETRDLRNKGLAIDFVGDNILYNTKDKSFKIIDLSPTKTTMGSSMEEFWNADVIKGVDQALPKKQSAHYLREALTDKLSNAFARSTDKKTGLYNLSHWDKLRAQTEGLSGRSAAYKKLADAEANRKVFEIKRLLAQQPVEKFGGGWLDNIH